MPVEPLPLGARPPEEPKTVPAIQIMVAGLVVGLAISSWIELQSLPESTPQRAAAAPIANPAGVQTAPSSSVSASPHAVRQPAERIETTRLPTDPVYASVTANRPARLDPPRSRSQSTAQHTPPAPTPQAQRAESIHVARVLVGGELLKAGIVTESLIKTQQDESRYVVCFLVSSAGALRCGDFRLQDREGTSYEPMCELSGAAQSGGQFRLVFSIYNDSAPEQLLYRSSNGRFAPLSNRAGR